MTLALWCVVVAGVMPYVLTLVAKLTGKRFNNRNPRRWQSKLEGRAARAHAAHLNAFEAFPLFAVAVIVAQMQGAAQGTVDALAVVFTVARIAYAIAYLADKATLRSLVWFVALISSLALFGVAAVA